MLDIQNLVAKIDEKDILKGLNLNVKEGEIHVTMGPNGSGKSTLSHALMGNPKFDVQADVMALHSTELLDLEADERAKLGVFMTFQYPSEIAGVQLDRLLFASYKNLVDADISVFDFNKKLKAEMERLGLPKDFASRSLNVGFSGGEKKKVEMLQVALLAPQLLIMDETDSGLDVDALKIVGESAQDFMKQEGRAIILVTHYERILQYIKPDYVHILVNGQIIKSGDATLADEIVANGYDQFINA
jgi:Fe-S cluster assembly ATP-binding protein